MFWIQVKTYLQKVDGQFWDSGLCAGSARPGRQSDLARSKKANQSLTRSDLIHGVVLSREGERGQNRLQNRTFMKTKSRAEFSRVFPEWCLAV